MEGCRGLFFSLVIAVCFYGNRAQRTECAEASVADIVFLVDGSSSIGVDNFQEVRHFLRSFIEGLDIGADRVRVGLAQYSNEPHQEFLLKDHTDKRSLLAQVDALPYRRGGTETGRAISFLQTHYFTEEAGSRADQRVPQTAVVITDGDSADDVVEPAQLLRRQGVIVFAIGVGAANQVELQAIANRPHERFLVMIDNYQALQRLSQGLLQTVCVSMRDQRLALAQRFADIFFLVDSGMTRTDFGQIRTLLVRLVTQLNIGASAYRLGLAQFGQDIKVEFLLNAYKTKEETLIGVRRFRQRRVQPNEPRNLGGALTNASTNFFTTEAGSRADQGYRFLVVVTGGDSDDDVYGASRLVKAEGVTVVGVGLGSATLREMKIVASSSYIYQTANIAPALRTLFETGQEMTTVGGGCVQTDEADIFFLVDHSGSIYPNDFHEIKNFIIEFLHTFRIGPDHVRVGVAKYSDNPELEFDLTTYSDADSLEKAVLNIRQVGGGTQTGAALSFMSPNFDRAMTSRGHKVPEFLIVITDGKSSDEVKGPAERLRAQGVVIYAIGVKNADETELQEIGGSPQKTFLANDFDALKPIKDDIITDICSPNECKKTEVDIIFMVDSSTSITLPKFQSMLTFMQSMVNETTVGEKLTRFGLILYSNEPKSMFTLNQYYTRKEVRNAIAELKSPYGDTYTGKALTYSLQYFDAANGGRRATKVPQILMVITDGDATDRNYLAEPSAALRNHGVNVISIGVEGANKTQLEVMAGDSSKVFYVDNFDTLESLSKNISIALYNIIKPACEKQEADLVMLIDQSGSISQADYSTMKKFMTELVASFNVSQESVRVGVAQFSSDAQKEFYLSEFDTEAAVNDRILSMTQLGGGTNIGKALEFIQSYFQTSTGSRISSGISQNLILIADGDSNDKVDEAAVGLRALGIEVFAIGIGEVHDLELLQITGTPKRLFTVQNFGSLGKIKQKVVDTICKSKLVPDSPGCSINIAMGFDISNGTESQLLVGGQPKLQSFLPEIIHSVSTLQGLCCVGPTPIKSDIGFRVVGRNGQILYDFGFEAYSAEVVKKVMDIQMSEPTYFNTALLESFMDKFNTQANAGVKVLVIFSDGLDDDVLRLEQESERLRQSGISALLIVALDGVQHPEQLQMVEFGRGFGYKLPLSIGMHSVGSIVLKQIDTVADRECCNVMCKCSGHEGIRGVRGAPGPKVIGT